MRPALRRNLPVHRRLFAVFAVMPLVTRLLPGGNAKALRHWLIVFGIRTGGWARHATGNDRGNRGGPFFGHHT